MTRFFLLLAAVFLPATLRAAPPNIIFVITDDQGWPDIAAHGNPVLKTPNLDKFRNESVRLNNYHVSPTCSPTRCALMTGRHEFKSGVTHTISERERMSLSATTLPQILHTAGYTNGIFGKWHLGDEDAYQPGKRGFDEVFIHGGGGIGQAYPGSCGDAPGNRYFDPVIRHNGTFVKTTGYCTDVFFRQATTWIEQQSKNPDKPFLCWIAPNAPHAPLDCPPEYEEPYLTRVPPDVAKFYGMITNIDDNVGRLVARVRELGLEKNTLIVFTTDNGSATGTKYYKGGLRASKGTPWQGGIRVPCFLRWPGTLQPGDRMQMTAHLDFLPTFAELAGATIPTELAKKLEGHSLVPLLKEAAAPWPDRYLFTHVGRWNTDKIESSKFAKVSVRWRNYSLVTDGIHGRKRWQLYDLNTDPKQEIDLYRQHPQITEQLEAAFDKWWAESLPALENENAPLAPENPFRTAYIKQFGNAPVPSANTPEKK